MPPNPENNDQFVGIRMPRAVAQKAKRAAKEDLRSLSNYIRKLIEDDLEAREHPGPDHEKDDAPPPVASPARLYPKTAAVSPLVAEPPEKTPEGRNRPKKS